MEKAGNPTAWETFTLEEGKYSVAFPGKPFAHVATVIDETVNPPNSVPVYSQRLNQDFSVIYNVSYDRLTWTPGAGGSERDALNDIVEADFGLTEVLSGKEVRVDGVLGFDVVWTHESRVRRHRVFIVNGCVLQQGYDGPAGTENSLDAERYFSSLRLWH